MPQIGTAAKSEEEIPMKNAFVFLAFTVALTSAVLAADVGPAADVAGVRAASHRIDPKRQVAGVHVVGNYALTDWYEGEASGYAAFRRNSDEHWRQIDFGGGVELQSLLVQKGVPAAVARKLCSGWGSASPC
jgi:hypothetical protein